MTQLTRAQILKKLKSEKQPFRQTLGGDYDNLIRRINDQSVVPVISNSVRNDRIFVNLKKLDADFDLNIDQIIAKLWADLLGYPLKDGHQLARVANFNRVKEAKDDEQAKTNYLTFLKQLLLTMAGGEPDPDLVNLSESFVKQILYKSFSDMVEELEYPKFKTGEKDSLNTLAELPFSIYLTTSYYDFLERALIANGRPPRTQVCFWSRRKEINVEPEHRTDHDFIPTYENPLVYHLHGFEKYPYSIVLSEDDYLDFLVMVSKDNVSNMPVIPLYLKEVISRQSLMLLGYNFQDWDFRSVFRGLIIERDVEPEYTGLLLQLDPNSHSDDMDPEETRIYLTNYFAPSSFEVIWEDVGNFIEKIKKHWDRWRKRDQGGIDSQEREHPNEE